MNQLPISTDALAAKLCFGAMVARRRAGSPSPVKKFGRIVDVIREDRDSR